MSVIQGLGQKLCWALAAAVLLTMAALYSYGWACALSAPLAIDYEGPNLWIIDQLAHGKNIYDRQTLSGPPWSVTIYTPIFFAVSAVLQQLFGFNYWSARLISIFAWIAATITAFRIFRISENNRLVSTVALAVLVSYLSYWSWSFYARVDMLGLAFSLFSIERFLIALKKKREKPGSGTGDTIISIICGAAAVFTKQPNVLVPIAISFYLLAERRFKEAFIYGGSSIALCLVILLGLQAVTAGGFIEHMRYASHMPFTFDQMYDHVFWIGHDLLKIIVLPILVLGWMMGRKRVNDDTIVLPLILTLSTGAVTLYTLGTVYPNTNHAFLFFFALTWLGAHLSRPYPSESSLTLLLPALASTAFVVYIAWINPVIFTEAETAALKAAHDKLPEMQMPGSLVFTEDPAYVLEMQATPLFVDIATFVQVWQSETRDNGGPLGEVAAGLNLRRYEAVLMNTHDAELKQPLYYWPKEVIEAVHKQYDRQYEVMGNRQPTVYYRLKGPEPGPKVMGSEK